MKTLVIYYSKFGNTREIADEIAETLESAGDVLLKPLDQLDVSDLEEAGLVVIGVPTHQMNLPDQVKIKLRSIPKRTLKRIPFAAFDTSYKMSPWLACFTASRKLAQRMRRLGGKRIVPLESFYVREKEGPLYDGEIGRARTWAKEILKRSEAFSGN